MIIELLLASIAVERCTEILVASEICAPVRQAIRTRAFSLDAPPVPTQAYWMWLNKLLSCGYCTSVWVAAVFLWPTSNADAIHWLIRWLVLHGLSNLYHVLYTVLMKGRVWGLDISVQIVDGSPLDPGVSSDGTIISVEDQH